MWRSAAVLIVCFNAAAAFSEDSLDMRFTDLSKDYGTIARPLLQRYCTDCHSSDAPEGDLDFEQFTNLAAVRAKSTTWVKVAEMLDDGQMPPQDAPQPSNDERLRLREWVRQYLHAEAETSAGDPGPVPQRRLSNAEYDYTIRDLTGLELEVTREFPADGAAGEGFTNAANALAMSPALLSKYLDAGKVISRHTVLLPDGFRFSATATRHDQAEEILHQIRELYGRYSDDSGATQVNLQGITFATNSGGRLPLQRYLAALLEQREALTLGRVSFESIAAERKLSARYLASLSQVLTSESPSLILDPIRDHFQQARPQDAAAIADEIAVWQNALSRFQNVGHMKPWVVAVDPIVTQQEIRHPLSSDAEQEIRLQISLADAGGGNANDLLVLERPRFVVPGQPDLLLRDLPAIAREAARFRKRAFASVVPALEAAAEALDAKQDVSVTELAARHGVDEDIAVAWFRCLGISTDAVADLEHLTQPTQNGGGFEFIRGWATGELPVIVANSSDRRVRIPGNMKPHGVAVHPTPTQAVAVGWRSPIRGTVEISGAVTHAHPECGNGVGWVLELRRGQTRRRLANGVSAGAKAVEFGPFGDLTVHDGDLVALVVEARDGNHSCDLTDVELRIKSEQSSWNLNDDVSADIQAGNPHADGYGNAGVWHFFHEASAGRSGRGVLPEGSLLDRWMAAKTATERQVLATQLAQLLSQAPPADATHPDALLYRQLHLFRGPLLGGIRPAEAVTDDMPVAKIEPWGLDTSLFGHTPSGAEIESASLCIQAPTEFDLRLPFDLVAGTEFIASGKLYEKSQGDGSVQLRVAMGHANPAEPGTQLASTLRSDLPVLVGVNSSVRSRFEKDFHEFRRWFPIALCYPKIVPTDEVITLTLHHREDEPLSRLMLNDEERQRLDRLWNELHFVSQDALTIVDAFAQLLEYASQDADPRVFEPLRKPIEEQAAAFRAALAAAEPQQVDALVDFAARVYRRPLNSDEVAGLRELYQQLRGEDLPHEEAFRLTLARLFVSPAFLYRLETAPPGTRSSPVSDWELANRLSYFLWSSVPDEPLRKAARSGSLHDPDKVAGHARRMLQDERVRRLATEFACQWLQIYEFNALDEKSERHFPEFAALRDDMYEEPIQFFTDLFQRDGSILEILDTDRTVLNEALAVHYGIPGVSGPEWRPVAEVKRFGRGGVLGFSATLAKHSGASRTSPTLRGAWISDVLLGEKLPAPPPDVPQLPEDVAADGLSVRELVERHASDPRCAGCHVRVDPLGFALERYDSIGRFREKDETGRSLDTRSTLRDGTVVDGVGGIRDYLLHKRRDTFVRQFCRKLLGYALGRSVRLSDEPLLGQMQQRLQQDNYRVSVAVEMIVRSPQFREIRGRDFEVVDAP